MLQLDAVSSLAQAQTLFFSGTCKGSFEVLPSQKACESKGCDFDKLERPREAVRAVDKFSECFRSRRIPCRVHQRWQPTQGSCCCPTGWKISESIEQISFTDISRGHAQCHEANSGSGQLTCQKRHEKLTSWLVAVVQWYGRAQMRNLARSVLARTLPGSLSCLPVRMEKISSCCTYSPTTYW